MNKAEAIGTLEMRMDETELIHIKGKQKSDPQRIWAEGKLEGLREGLNYLKLVEGV